jgi:chitin disaccharide deacetylase
VSALLILNADDLGYDPAVTRGILEAMTLGVVSSTTAMVNTPHSEAAAQAARATAAPLSIGLHFNLARWAPLTRLPAEVLDSQGHLSAQHVKRLSAAEVAAELRAQLERFRALFERAPTHVDLHKHLHRNDRVFEGVLEVAAAQRLPVRSIDALMRQALRARGLKTNDHFLGDAGDEAFWTPARLQAQLRLLPTEGSIELMCHPGYTPETLKSAYGVQREVELQAFTHPDALGWVKGCGARVGGFGALD